jgi:hypothetical protein
MLLFVMALLAVVVLFSLLGGFALTPVLFVVAGSALIVLIIAFGR